MTDAQVTTIRTPYRRELSAIVIPLDTPPLLLIVAITAMTLGLNQWIGLRWTIQVTSFLWLPGFCFALATVYAVMRPNPVIREMGLYLGFWCFYPIFAVQLIYLVSRAGFPLEDKFFIAADTVLGFHWDVWSRAIESHPLLLVLQRFAYDSSYWQPLVSIPFLAVFGPRGRNAELLTSILLALSLTVLVYMVVPTLGPSDMAGIKATGQVIQELRAGYTGPYHYYGIIAFPSFHTMMAILYILAHRGIRSFPLALGLNLMMLSAVPNLGDHYLCDVIAGIPIAIASFFATRWLYRRLAAGEEQRRLA